MKNYKVTMAFNGSNYHGFQRQSNALAVQEVVEKAASRLLDEKVTVFGCSRTDAKVHAKQFVFNFHTESSITEKGIVMGMNSLLPDDIAVLSCEQADDSFHARYDCKGKTYEYIVHNSSVKNPFLTDLVYRYRCGMDTELMNASAQAFVGTHDFKSFCCAACGKEVTVRTVDSFSVERQKDDLVVFRVRADGFLYNMVRIMVGTLIFINEGKIPPDAVPKILEACDRKRAGKTVPPQGLYLTQVYY